MDKRNFNIHLPSPLRILVKVVAAERGITMAALVIEAIKAKLGKEKKI